MGYPDKVVVPGSFDCGMLCIIILSSFFGQMLLNHSFQIQNAAKGSSINCTQVYMSAINSLVSALLLTGNRVTMQLQV